jgi:hypothetical protein
VAEAVAILELDDETATTVRDLTDGVLQCNGKQVRAALEQIVASRSAVAAGQIDPRRMQRIFEMLGEIAAKSGKRWPERRKLATAIEVYNFLAPEARASDTKIERVLRLVVNN